MKNCIFCELVEGKTEAKIIYEDEKHIAFLTPFPNTEGFTVVATKEHLDSYIFNLKEKDYLDLMLFSRKVGKMLGEALETKRTSLIMEGMGINHAHVKLVPLYGIEGDNWKQVKSNYPKFYPKYPGYVASHDGPKMDVKRLNQIHKKILKNVKDLKLNNKSSS